MAKMWGLGVRGGSEKLTGGGKVDFGRGEWKERVSRERRGKD